MAALILLNKPFRTLCQFSDSEGRTTLAQYVDQPGVYPAGRLDYDSEGLVLLTDDGELQHRIASPRHKMSKTYLVQVEGDVTEQALDQLRNGVDLKDGRTLPASARRIAAPTLWPRTPPVRERANIPTSWVELRLTEGKNRQVRRMTAATGFPTLRLVRWQIGEWSLKGLAPGEYRQTTIHLPGPAKAPNRRPQRRHASNRHTRRRPSN